jgi:hypothetical protein
MLTAESLGIYLLLSIGECCEKGIAVGGKTNPTKDAP